MEADEFTRRLAQIRQRFAASLSSKIDDSFASLSVLSDSGAAAIEMIVVTHRKLHEMCGLAPSIGFPNTGKAARAAESLLREPAERKRSLTVEEIAAFTADLACLRAAALSDLRSAAGSE